MRERGLAKSPGLLRIEELVSGLGVPIASRHAQVAGAVRHLS